MKKLKKIYFIMLLSFFIFNPLFNNITYANQMNNIQINEKYEVSKIDVNPYEYNPGENVDGETITKYTGSIYNILFVLAIIISVIVISIIGLKYIVGSASEKADYKKNLIQVVVGIIIIVSIFSIVSILYNLGDKFTHNQVNDNRQKKYDHIQTSPWDDPYSNT